MEVVERVAERITGGLTVAEACLCEEPPIRLNSFTAAVSRGGKFAAPYARAKAIRLGAWVERVKMEGSKGASGVMWLLERAHKERYGTRNAGVNITNQVAVCGLNPQELEQFRAAVKRAVDEASIKKEIET